MVGSISIILYFQNYKCQVCVRTYNKWGWSNLSKAYMFKTSVAIAGRQKKESMKYSCCLNIHHIYLFIIKTPFNLLFCGLSLSNMLQTNTIAQLHEANQGY